MSIPPLLLTRELAYAAALDAANRAMRVARRTSWDESDAEVTRLEFDRLWPLCEHGVDPENCAFCPILR